MLSAVSRKRQIDDGWARAEFERAQQNGKSFHSLLSLPSIEDSEIAAPERHKIKSSRPKAIKEG